MRRTLQHFIFKLLIWVVTTIFTLSLINPSPVFAQNIYWLPVPGTMVTPTSTYQPALMMGLEINPLNPLKFNFMIDTGDTNLSGDAFADESTKLIKYFLASLTTPDDELWVNLTPNQKDQVISKGLGQTAMGRDLLKQDYLLKQLSASLMYPEKKLGKQFWERFYSKVHQRFGAEEIPTDVFHKIWIVPKNAVIYQQANSAYIVNSHLKVMLEDDYLTMDPNMLRDKRSEHKTDKKIQSVAREIIKEILIPEIEREVNEGMNFAELRQIYNSMILATWYKMNLKDSMLGEVYIDQNKTMGIDIQDKQASQKIYDQYMHALKKGVYNYIKEDVDPISLETIPRQYFSGGLIHLDRKDIRVLKDDPQRFSPTDQAMLNKFAETQDHLFKVTTNLYDLGTAADQAVISEESEERIPDDQLKTLLEAYHHNILQPVNLEKEVRYFQNELAGAGSIVGSQPLKYMSVYNFVDQMTEDGYKGGYLLGMNTWQQNYGHLARMSGLTTWQEAHRAIFGKETERSEEFLKEITARATADKPIYFLIPREIFSHPMNNISAKELRWLLENPEQLEHVHFVFGAYNVINPSEWHRSALSALTEADENQRQQIFSYLLRHHLEYQIEQQPQFPTDSKELIVNASVRIIADSFEEYYVQFKHKTARAKDNFRQRNWNRGAFDSQMKLLLHDGMTRQSATHVGVIMHEYVDAPEFWADIRQTLQTNYLTEGNIHKLNLMITFLDAVQSQLTDHYVRSDDVDIDTEEDEPVRLKKNIDKYRIGKLGIREVVRLSIEKAGFKELYKNLSYDSFIAATLLTDQVEEFLPGATIKTIEILKPVFYRNKAAYIVGRITTDQGQLPLVLPLKHQDGGVILDAALASEKNTKNLLLSSTRSAFHVDTPYYAQVTQFLAELFPDVNRAQINDLLGLTQRAQQIYLGDLRDHLEEGNQLEFLGEGPESVTIAAPGSPLALKVIRDDAPNRQEIVRNYHETHKLNRLGQLLDSWQYQNVRLPRHMLSDELLSVLVEKANYDVRITDEYVILNNVYAQRRIASVPDALAAADPETKRDILLKIGWNIKHLASMGIFPTDMSLRHFGVTSWGRVVYLNSAGLGKVSQSIFTKIQMYQSMDTPIRLVADPDSSGNLYQVFPNILNEQLNIPHPFRAEFNKIHGDLFTTNFWHSVQWRMNTDQLPDVNPYSSKYRLNLKRIEMILKRWGVNIPGERIKLPEGTRSLEISETSIQGLNFLQLRVPNPRARILVVEPIGPGIVSMLHRNLGNVDYDIIQAESEIVEETEYWTPGVQGKLKALVQSNHYDYVLGYVNETFDAQFFDEAKIKGLLLFSTGLHNIDVKAATENNIVVTNAPGPTTVAVAEQNIGLMLDAIYTNHVFSEQTRASRPLTEMVEAYDGDPDAVAQILWYSLLRRSLKLDDMFGFVEQGRYSRTGIGPSATVYHDQLGQNRQAKMTKKIGVIGLDRVGVRLVEMAIAHEIHTIYVPEDEYEQLDQATKQRFQDLIKDIQENKKEFDISISIQPESLKHVIGRPNYTIATPFGRQREDLQAAIVRRTSETLQIDPNNIFVDDNPLTLQRSMANLNVGIQGLGRIGKAVAQRLVPFGANIRVNQRGHLRRTYQTKKEYLDGLIAPLNESRQKQISQVRFVDQDELLASSNVLTTLTPLTAETEAWLGSEELAAFGSQAEGAIRAIVSQVKNLIDEEALLEYLHDREDVEVRLDVVNQEEKGDAHLRFRDKADEPMPNVKIAGHTAAAVLPVRRLKIQKALDNLKYLIEDRIPPNIINPDVMYHKEEDIEMAGLKFRRMTTARPKANVLVVEPLNPDIIDSVNVQFPDVNFDVIQPESEIIERDGHLISGIDPSIDQIVSQNEYDFCVGYCNTKFDDEFFEKADLKGLVLFASAEHHIDLEAATRHKTLVTTAPGPTTTAVAEQNISLALDGVFGDKVSNEQMPEAFKLSDIKVTSKRERLAQAQVMWYSLMKKVLKLDEMFEFGRSGNYARTGVALDSTVYHNQIGQNKEAGINNSVGILGLQTAGVQLLELAIAHEAETVYVLKNEYEKLGASTKNRINELIKIIEQTSQSDNISINIKLVEEEHLIRNSTFILKTPGARKKLAAELPEDTILVTADEIFVNDPQILQQSLRNLNFGVHGIRRIGTAVAQRALAFGVNLLVDTESLDTRDIEDKQEGFRLITRNRRRVFGRTMQMPYYVDKNTFFKESHIVTTLGDSSEDENFGWLDKEALDQFGTQAEGSTRVLINASKYQADEEALIEYARKHPGVEIRLDVLNDEASGAAKDMFVDEEGAQLANIKLSGHTAAAVWDVRKLKIRRALNNLRKLIDGEIPDHIQNPDVLQNGPKNGENPDNAMTAQENEIKKVGGINLNPKLLDLQIKRDDKGIPLPVSQQPLENLNIQGFLPVIIQIQPITNLPILLGIRKEEDDPQFGQNPTRYPNEAPSEPSRPELGHFKPPEAILEKYDT